MAALWLLRCLRTDPLEVLDDLDLEVLDRELELLELPRDPEEYDRLRSLCLFLPLLFLDRDRDREPELEPRRPPRPFRDLERLDERSSRSRSLLRSLRIRLQWEPKAVTASSSPPPPAPGLFMAAANLSCLHLSGLRDLLLVLLLLSLRPRGGLRDLDRESRRRLRLLFSISIPLTFGLRSRPSRPPRPRPCPPRRSRSRSRDLVLSLPSRLRLVSEEG